MDFGVKFENGGGFLLVFFFEAFQISQWFVDLWFSLSPEFPKCLMNLNDDLCI